MQGIAIRGVYDTDDNFKVDYYFPYCKGGNFSTDAELRSSSNRIKKVIRDFVMRMRLGVNLIFTYRMRSSICKSPVMVMMEIVFADLI